MKPLALVRLLSLAALSALILSAALVLWSQRSSFSAPSVSATGAHLDQFGPAPAFQFTDQLGRPVAATDLREKIVIANFIYTSCPDICPLLSAQMQQLQTLLRAEGLLGQEVQLLSITVDPARDTTAVLRSYADRLQADPDAWRFLRGTEAETRAVVVDGFKLGVEIMDIPQRQAEQTTGDAAHNHYEVAHSGRFVLIDPDWMIRAYYDGAAFDAEQILADIRRVMREAGR